MNKALEALDRIRRFNNCEIKEPHLEEELNIIESALEELKDIEEELGIDLNTLITAITKGYCVREGKRIVKIKLATVIANKFVLINGQGVIWRRYYFKDYGKTWALTREELEK